MAHCTNLVVQTLTNFEVMKHVEDVLATPCPYFSSSPKPTLEFHKFATSLESKGNQIIRNINTRWISMFRPTKRVFEECKPLVTNMPVDAPKEPVAKNLSILLD